MKAFNIKIATLIALLAIFALAGCSNTDVLCDCDCEPNKTAAASQRIAFNWEKDPLASPAGMRVWFYPLDWKGDAFPIDFPGKEGGSVNITSGNYGIIAYNNDTEWVLADKTGDFGNHRLTTRDASILEPLGITSNEAETPRALPETDFTSEKAPAPTGQTTVTTDERVAACPQPVWGVAEQSRYADNSSTILLTPVPLYCHYTFTFEGLGNMEHIAKASAAISGMDAAVSLSKLQTDQSHCTHPLQASIDRSNNSVYGDFYTFGVNNKSGKRNRMSLFVILDDGRGFKFTEGDNLDVTSQILTAPDPRNVNLIVRGLTIPTPTPETKGDFQVSVDDWGEDVNKNIPL